MLRPPTERSHLGRKRSTSPLSHVFSLVCIGCACTASLVPLASPCRLGSWTGEPRFETPRVAATTTTMTGGRDGGAGARQRCSTSGSTAPACSATPQGFRREGAWLLLACWRRRFAASLPVPRRPRPAVVVWGRLEAVVDGSFSFFFFSSRVLSLRSALLSVFVWVLGVFLDVKQTGVATPVKLSPFSFCFEAKFLPPVTVHRDLAQRFPCRFRP